MENVQSAWSKMDIIQPRYQIKRYQTILWPVSMKNTTKDVPYLPRYFYEYCV